MKHGHDGVHCGPEEEEAQKRGIDENSDADLQLTNRNH